MVNHNIEYFDDHGSMGLISKIRMTLIWLEFFPNFYLHTDFQIDFKTDFDFKMFHFDFDFIYEIGAKTFLKISKNCI